MQKLALFRILVFSLALFLWPRTAPCQSSLGLSSTTVAPGSVVSLPLSLSSIGTAPAGLEWTLTYPAAASNVSVAAGPALTAAGKTVACTAISGGYTCIASGMNSNVISNGVIATVSTTVSGSATIIIGVDNAMAASSSGNGLAVSATGGAIALTAGPAVSTISCNSASLNPGASALCTVTLSSPVPSGGANVALGVTGNIDVTPASIAIAAGASSGTFTATAGQFSSAQSGSVTASLNGSYKTANFSLTVSALLSSLQCTASTLASNASTTCTVTLTMAAPSGGASVALSGIIAKVFTIPVSVTVPVNSRSVTFTANTSAIPSDQSVTITASFNGSSKTTTLSLTAPVMLSSLQCAASSLGFNASTTCTVTLTKVAPSGGASVALAGAIAGVLAVPTSVTVPAGSKSATFTVRASLFIAAQTAVITASYNSTTAKVNISLTFPLTLSSFTCAPISIQPGSSGSCTVYLSIPAPTVTALTLTSSNSQVSVPASISVPIGSSSASFSFTTANTLSGPFTLTASLSGLAISVTLSASSSSSQLSMSLACPPNASPGSLPVCELQLGSLPRLPMSIGLSSSSRNVTVPASLRVRPGQGRIRFAAAIDPQAGAESATVNASYGAVRAHSPLRVDASASLSLNLPGSWSAMPGDRVRFHISAISSDGLPVVLSALRLPAGAAFDPVSGDFEWTVPANRLGTQEVVFAATTAAGISASKSVRVQVGTPTPKLTGLLNAAGAAATAACTPGSVATLAGEFLSAGDTPRADRSGASLELGGTSVLVNGTRAPVLFASAGRVDFLCPQGQAGELLEIAVRNGQHVSPALPSTLRTNAPGILTLEGAGAQAAAFPAGTAEVAALPNPRFAARPVLAGELLSVLATGISCDPYLPSGRPQLQLGMQVMPIQTIQPAAGYAGVCAVSFAVPPGVSGDAVPLRLQVVNYDGTVAESNPASVAVTDGQ